MIDEGNGKISRVTNVYDGEERLSGSAVAYRVSPEEVEAGDIDAYSCDFDVDFDGLSFPRQLRENGQEERRGSVKYGSHHRSLSDEVLVLFGPDVSARKAIKYLRYPCKRIERLGLLVRSRGGWSKERIKRGSKLSKTRVPLRGRG